LAAMFRRRGRGARTDAQGERKQRRGTFLGRRKKDGQAPAAPAIRINSIDASAYQPSESAADKGAGLSDNMFYEFMDWLGIPEEEEEEFGWIAEEASMTPIPEEWVTRNTDDGRTYYHNTATKAIRWEHPVYVAYRELYEEERDRLADERAALAQRCLLVCDLPADADDKVLEDDIAACFGEDLWADEVLQFDLFVDNSDERYAIVRFVDEEARAEALALGTITLPQSGGSTCPLVPVDDHEEVDRMEDLAKDSRCATVANLPPGIDDQGFVDIFSPLEGSILSLRIEDLGEQEGAIALVEFASSISARKSVSLNLFNIDGRFLSVTLGVQVFNERR